ncbi:4888_t:CDS:10 [Acaulospora morrowiae]|uniref:4888_t:CDS:1 n=1 Tax=Acaulospora morrowiae TaxID=94023 RepID=A0A9N9AAN4_9GLOM|nr:4888_t:CDS:10 [Acaulospora morrowiae]
MSNDHDSKIGVSELKALLNQLNSSSGIEDQVIENLEHLVSGLRACKNVIIDQGSTTKSKSDAWSNVASVVEIFANSSKKEKPRDPLGNYGVIELIIEFMKLNDVQSQPSVDFQCLRALANICISSDTNRQRILDSGGVETLLTCIRKQSNLDTIKGACATLLNVGMNYDNANVEIVKSDGLIVITRLLEPNTILGHYETHLARPVVYFATRLVINLVGTDEGKQKIADKEIIASLVHLLSYSSSKSATDDDVDLLENVLEILEIASLDNDEVQQILVQDGFFPGLLDFLEFSREPPDCEKNIVKRYGECKAVALKIIVVATGSDRNMEPLFDDTVIFHRLLHWLNLGPERDDLQMCAALSLGNLARTSLLIQIDAHCIKLVHEFKIVEPLVNVLRTSNNVKVQHAVVGILKNLSLPAQNKTIIGSLGVIGLVSPFLEKDDVQSIQLGAVGILKHLATQNVVNCKKILLGENPDGPERPLTRILNLIKRTDNVAVKSEGTRIIFHLIKNVWAGDPHLDLEGTHLNTLRLELNRKEVVRPLANMITESKYPILQNEGVMALALLVMDDSAGGEDANPTLNILTSSEQQIEEIADEEVADKTESEIAETSSPDAVKPLTTLEALLGILQSKQQEEIKINVCSFLEKSANSANGTQKQYLREKVLLSLKSLISEAEKGSTHPGEISINLKGKIEDVIKCLG